MLKLKQQTSQILAYFIAGVLTTLVNLLVFTILNSIFGSSLWWISNFPAIMAAILFAFWSNRKFVFKSSDPWLPELGRFLAARAFTALAFEYGAMYLLTELLGLRYELVFANLSILVSKLLSQILVLVGNYVFSKLFIFQGQTGNRQKKA